MKRISAVALIVLSLIVPSRLLAKGATSKIVIEGADLTKPIEITDRKTLVNFNVWTGPGTFSTQSGFDANRASCIVDWSKGTVTDLPQGLRRYQVSFYSDELGEGPFYVVYYAIAPGSEHGYVLLPGKSDRWWGLNVGSILRGCEGEWFHAWRTWDGAARPLIKKAIRTGA